MSLSLLLSLSLNSKTQCLHFSCWDTHKDWIVDLPKGEDVRALCLGQGWVAVATSALMVRLFSIGGVQKEIFSLPGAVVCMAGHGEQLLIVYHRGTDAYHSTFGTSTGFNAMFPCSEQPEALNIYSVFYFILHASAYNLFAI